MSFAAFFFLYNKIGFFNRLMFCLVSTQALVFVTKCNLYKQCVDELNFEMTLTGQESRILSMFYFPEHPQISLYKELCKKYKEHSANIQTQE